MWSRGCSGWSGYLSRKNNISMDKNVEINIGIKMNICFDVFGG